mgnify:CR=1 FL=1
MKLPVAIQVYSVRDDAAADLRGTLEKIKEMGYDGVELAGLFGHCPKKVKHWCDSLGLNPISAHVPLADMLADVDKVIADYKAVGCEYIVVPYVTAERRPGGELFMQMIEEIRTIGTKAKEAGLVLLYHNHDFEFIKMPNGQYGLDYIYSTIGPELLETELDTCWVKVAGECPVAYIKKYANRCPVVHLKDFKKSGDNLDKLYDLIGIMTFFITS